MSSTVRILAVILGALSCVVPAGAQQRAEAFLPKSTYAVFSIEDVPAARRAAPASRMYRFLHRPENAEALGVRPWDEQAVSELVKAQTGFDYKTLIEAFKGQACLAVTDIPNLDFQKGVIRVKVAAVVRVGDDPTLVKVLEAAVDRDLRRRAELPPGVADPNPLFGLVGVNEPAPQPKGVLDPVENRGHPREVVEARFQELKKSEIVEVDSDGVTIAKYQYTPKRYMSWAVVDGWLLVAGPYKTNVEQLLRIVRDPERKSLLDDEAFDAARTRHVTDGTTAFGYLGLGSFLDRFQIMLPPAAMQALERLGLRNIASVAVSERAVQGDFRMMGTLATRDGKLAGLPAAVAGKPLENDWLARVPADAPLMGVTGADVPAMTRLIVSEVQTQIAPFVRMIVPKVPEPMSAAWSIFNDRLVPAAAPGMVGFVSIVDNPAARAEVGGATLIRLSKPEAFQNALDDLFAKLRVGVGEMNGFNPMAEMSEFLMFVGSPQTARIGGERGYTWDLSKLDDDIDVTMSAVVAGEWFVRGNPPGLLESVIRAQAASIATDARFEKALGDRLTDPTVRGVWFADAAALYRFLHHESIRDREGKATDIGRRILKGLRDGGIDPDRLPAPEAVAEALRPVAATLRTEGGTLIMETDAPAGPTLWVTFAAEQLLGGFMAATEPDRNDDILLEE